MRRNLQEQFIIIFLLSELYLKIANISYLNILEAHIFISDKHIPMNDLFAHFPG